MWFGRDQVKRVTDSVTAIGSSEVGGVGEESNVTNPDEYTNEVHLCCMQDQCGGVRPKIAVRIETDGDRFRASVGGVPGTSEVVGTG